MKSMVPRAAISDSLSRFPGDWADYGRARCTFWTDYKNCVLRTTTRYFQVRCPNANWDAGSNAIAIGVNLALVIFGYSWDLLTQRIGDLLYLGSHEDGKQSIMAHGIHGTGYWSGLS